MLVYDIKNRLASFLDEKSNWVNLHKIFCTTRLLWDKMVKTTGVTVFVSSVCMCIWQWCVWKGPKILIHLYFYFSASNNINSRKMEDQQFYNSDFCCCYEVNRNILNLDINARDTMYSTYKTILHCNWLINFFFYKFVNPPPQLSETKLLLLSLLLLCLYSATNVPASIQVRFTVIYTEEPL